MSTTKESQTSPSTTVTAEPPSSPKSVMDIRGLVLGVFRDLLDGMYSVIEEYEDDPEWNNKLEEEDSNDCEIVLEEDDNNEVEEVSSKAKTDDNLMTCSTCGKKKSPDCFGYKSKDVLYKSCTECREKKKRRYEEVKKVATEEDSKRRKCDDGYASHSGKKVLVIDSSSATSQSINSSAGDSTSTINRSINSNTGVAKLDISQASNCVIN